MKTKLALIALLSTTSVAAAGEIGFNAKAEYAMEAGEFNLSAGSVYTAGNFEFFGEADFTTAGTTDIAFDNLETGVAYNLNHNTQVYGMVELDSDFEYAETTVGVAVNF